MLPGQDATIYELIVTTFIFTAGFIIIARYMQTKKPHVLFLALFCLFAGTGTMCSFIARVLVNFMGFTGTENYIFAMFVRDHFAQMFIALATISFHYFSKNVFGQEGLLQKTSVIDLFGLGIIAFLFWAPLDLDSPVHTIGYLFLFVFCFYVFIPTIVHSKRAQAKVEDPVYRAGFKGMRYLSYSYVSTLLSFMFDQVVFLVMGWQFNPFYYAGWILAMLAAVSGYLGFLLPKWFKRLIAPKQ